ncbi:MAG: MFS transporter [Clostridia bacterium]|nr:MFS transporter [Clostridia bacterium]
MNHTGKERKDLFSTPLFRSRVKSANVKLPEIVFGYLIGPFGAMLAGGIFSSFLNKYWTEVLFAGQLTPAVNTFLTLLPLLSAILIVVGNLVAGQVIERTKSKAGKARPWIFLSAITVAVTSVLLFVCPSEDPVVKMVMTGISYNLYYAIASPLYNTANSTMIPVSTRSGKQRSLLASASNMAGLAVMGVGSMVFPTLLGLLVTETTPIRTAQNYWFMLFAIVALITFVGALLQYYFTRERVTEESMNHSAPKKLPVMRQLKAVTTDKFWWIIIAFYLLYQISGAIKNLSMTYFTAQIVDNSFWGASLDANTAAGMTQSLLGILGAIPMAVAGIFIWPISNKIGKQKLVIAGMMIGAAGGVIAGIWADNVVMVAIGVALKCLGSAPAGYLILAMISDSLDHIEAKHGFRCDGFTMSIYSSIMVASAPIGQAIFNGITQSGTNLTGITVSYIWIETVAYALCAVVLLFFTVEKFLKKDQETILNRQKAEAEANGEEWIEPAERLRREEEEADRLAEISRIEELKARCEKKGLDFEVEEANYQKKHNQKKK